MFILFSKINRLLSKDMDEDSVKKSRITNRLRASYHDEHVCQLLVDLHIQQQ